MENYWNIMQFYGKTHNLCAQLHSLSQKGPTWIKVNSIALKPELFLFTAAKNYGHKCFITERKQREMGHNTEPLFVNKPPDVSSKPTEKRGLGQMRSSILNDISRKWLHHELLSDHWPIYLMSLDSCAVLKNVILVVGLWALLQVDGFRPARLLLVVWISGCPGPERGRPWRRRSG